MKRIYLGDGVYAEFDESRDAIILTTENGVEVTNTIVLDQEVYSALTQFVEHIGIQEEGIE